MELTKKDQRHIEEEVRKVARRIHIEATEYARLYEISYLQSLKAEIEQKIEDIQFIADCCIESANSKD